MGWRIRWLGTACFEIALPSGKTLVIDPYLWFQTNGLFLDPFNQTQQIEDLIKASFASAFRDNDRNGDPD